MTALMDRTASDEVLAHPHRFRLSRAGILNVWQYDEQVFDFADGRLLLRGANGAGKAKTLEMLLPFVLDGDKMRMTASGRHHTSLLWLMTDGYEGQGRTGYLWVEFTRTTDDGEVEWLTCGVGVRASVTAKTATSWYFTSPRRIGQDLDLEDEGGPLSRDRCEAAVEDDGRFFEKARPYKEHVGETLFGLVGPRYDELLRLLYWLRQPQIGEDIEPARLAQILSVALPELDGQAVRSAGGTLDELAAFGEDLLRKRQASEAIAGLADTYAGYARGEANARGRAFDDARRKLVGLNREVVRRERAVTELDELLTQTEDEHQTAERDLHSAEERLAALEASPEARNNEQVIALGKQVEGLRKTAEVAQRNAAKARASATSARTRLDQDGAEVIEHCRALARVGQHLADDAAGLGLGREVVLGAALLDPQLSDAMHGLDAAVTAHRQSLADASPAIGELKAALRVVDEARRETVRLDQVRSAAEATEAQAERDAEGEEARLVAAERTVRIAEDAYRAALAEWRADDVAVTVEVPEVLSEQLVSTIAGIATATARPRIDELNARAVDAAAGRARAERSLTELDQARVRVEAERDPAPDAPPLLRSERRDDDGVALWRAVDFHDSLDEAARSGLEAALESSGLLDAWIRVDGEVLDSAQHDLVLPSGSPVAQRHLGELLTVDLPDDCRVVAETISGVLARVGVRPDDSAPIVPDAYVDVEGRWKLGPLTGRATKARAQYIGATARLAERERRLAEIEQRKAAETTVLERETAAERQALAARAAIEEWLALAPAYGGLLKSWADEDSQRASAERAADKSRAAVDHATSARADAAASRRALDDLANAHRLPTDEDGLRARAARLGSFETQVERQQQAAGDVLTRTTRWRSDEEQWGALDAHAGELEQGADHGKNEAAAQAARHRELEAALRSSVRELQERMAHVRSTIETTRSAQQGARRQLQSLTSDHGGAVRDVAHSVEQRDGHLPVLLESAQAMGALADIAGLLRSAGAPTEVSTYELARRLDAGAAVPASVAELARALVAIEPPARAVTASNVWERHREVTSGPAADYEPSVRGEADRLSVIARDDSGEHAIGEFTERLAARVAGDAELLTERERKLFEEHVLGELGESLRRCKTEADDLVAAMNRLLGGVSTSQGVRVRLSWKLRDDVPEEARRAVELLVRPIGALMPDERAELRDAMHRLIEASRAEEPELSYTDHLGRALDYRQWFAFRVRYTRPEHEGSWKDLHRKTPLSQGEQKVVCYLPLFAAAAAHFSSVAGAAPHAPRFVLLDDAFPKIDVRTHPLLFGLLVDLDLDFVITSERLWGDHASVPSLAVYEALRDPNERGVAQYQHRWDGHRLRSVGG